MKFLDSLNSLLECSTEEAWTNSLVSIASNLGFNHVLYGCVSNKLSPLDKAFIRSNYSREWRRAYDDNKLHKVDPTVSHCLKSSLPLIWKPETFTTPPQKKFYEAASGYGLRTGITLPAHGGNGEFGILSFALDSIPKPCGILLNDVSLAQLTLVRDYAFESSLKFLAGRPAENEPVTLTNRERECLLWIINGKSSWEASRLLNCSEATINFHVTNIKSKFNVRTRRQAAVKAIAQGLIVL